MKRWAGDLLAMAVLLILILAIILPFLWFIGVSRHRVEGSGYVREIWGVRV